MKAKVGKRFFSGWIRLWIVASVVLGCVMYAITANDERYLKVYMLDIPIETVKTVDDEQAVISLAMQKDPGLKDCHQKFVMDADRGGGSAVWCPRTGLQIAERVLPYALIPAVLLYVFGLIVAWIRKGFASEE